MQSILITGASSGFGRAVALELAREGWLVFASMRDLAKAGALLEQAGDARERIVPIALDVTDPAGVRAAVDSLLERTGGVLDAVLSNAGYSILGAFEDYADELCRQQMETNFFGALNVIRAVLPAMRAAGKGRIVIVSSNAVNAPHPLLTMYAASKWALEGWAEGLAMELAPFGIEVRVVQPGAHRTEFAGNVRFVLPENSAYAAWIEQAMPGIENLDRWGRDPGKAVPPIIAAVCAENAPFRQQIGEDAQVFAALKANVPFEARAFALRAIVGLPGASELARSPTPREETYPVLSEILKRGMNFVQDNNELSAVVAGVFGLDH
jgi:NAD(P)-dependent dehydrogenase (short-subunit alcohol dehydrogenase family)